MKKGELVYFKRKKVFARVVSRTESGFIRIGIIDPEYKPIDAWFNSSYAVVLPDDLLPVQQGPDESNDDLRKRIEREGE